MALFKISKGNSSNLPTNKVDGYCYVTLDEHKLYVDYTNSDNELDRFALNAVRADTAAEADKLSVNTAGSSTRPVYFSGGVPVQTGTSLAVSITGSAAKWATKRNFTITDGTNTSTAVSVDGSGNVALNLPTTIKATLSGNAATATNATAADKLNSNAGDANTPVYFSGGVPVICTSLDLNTTGSAAKWTTARAFKISDADASNTSTGVNVDGSAAVTLKLPSTIKATLVGNASTATNATAANKLNSNAGSTTLPVYFSGGVPVETSDTLAVNITKNAATATKWANARTITISDGTNKGTAASIDGSANITVDLPDTIIANLTGKATSAGTADKLGTNAGDASTPVYFSGGIPTKCTSLDLNTTGSAAKWTTARKIYIADDSETNTGDAVSVDGSADAILKLPATIKATLTGNADTATNADAADKLNSDAGSSTLPVYFSAGIPTDCGDTLDVNISKNAATATTLATARAFAITDADGTNTGTGFNFDGSAGGTFNLPATIKANITGNVSGKAGSADKLNSNAGDANTPVYFSGGIPSACTSLDLNTSGYAQKTYIAYSTTAAATAAKVASTTGNVTFPTTITEGTRVSVQFQYGNTAASPTLKVGTSNAIAIIPTTVTWDAGQTLDFVYDGNAWAPIEAYKAAYATKANNANSATSATQAGKLTTTTAGDASTPVYFSGGIPTVCTSLSLNTTGNAATATTLETSRNLTIMDYSLTYEGGVQPFDGSEDIILEMPAEFEGTLHGNADTATKLATARTITLAGDLSGAAKFDGSGDISISAAVKDNSHTHLYAGSSTAGGAATSADKLTTARTIALTGDVTGSGTFDGSGNLSITTAVADNSHNHSYLPLAGGTMTGVIDKAGSSSSWINGRDKALVRLSSYNAYSALAAMKTTNGSWDMGVYTNDYMYFTYTPDTNYSAGTNNGYVQVKISPAGALTAPSVYGAVWNDYAEYRSQKEEIKPGYCVVSADNGQVYKTTEKFQACDGIVSDTFGFAIGETNECKTPLAVAGRVLAYCEGDRYDYHSGDTVCAGPDGKVVRMTREEIREWPDRIVGIVSEIPEYETWGTGNVTVDGRIWIKVK